MLCRRKRPAEVKRRQNTQQVIRSPRLHGHRGPRAARDPESARAECRGRVRGFQPRNKQKVCEISDDGVFCCDKKCLQRCLSEAALIQLSALMLRIWRRNAGNVDARISQLMTRAVLQSLTLYNAATMRHLINRNGKRVFFRLRHLRTTAAPNSNLLDQFSSS